MGKLRKCSLAVLLGFAVVIAGLWVWAQFYCVIVTDSWNATGWCGHFTLGVAGRHGFVCAKASEIPGFTWTVASQSDEYGGTIWPDFHLYSNIIFAFVVPYWLLILLALIPATLLWHFRPRPNALLCSHCNYNLTGNTSGVCPECGTATLLSSPQQGERR